jgi:uncharacterized membrane protein
MRDTLEMAREAGIAIRSNWAEQELKAFEALVRADEREACAKVCLEQSARWHNDQRDVYVAHECAAAIRARGNG